MRSDDDDDDDDHGYGYGDGDATMWFSARRGAARPSTEYRGYRRADASVRPRVIGDEEAPPREVPDSRVCLCFITCQECLFIRVACALAAVLGAHESVYPYNDHTVRPPRRLTAAPRRVSATQFTATTRRPP